jgi:iron complex outermembrane recepter protein
VSHRTLLAGASCLALSFAVALPAIAQDETAAENRRTFGEIVVTAQKREQSLQDVPVSVQALDTQILEDAGIKDIKDLTILTPGLLVTSTTSDAVTTARIRGVGTVGDNPGLESSVGVVIDGIYRPRNGVGFGDLGEIERIEVLKGPQGTLFGKNTSAGVINVITKAPEFEFGATGEVTVGNYGKWGLSGSLTGPIVEDKLAFRIYATQQERDGFIDVNTGPTTTNVSRTAEKDADQDYWSVRGQLLYTPNENIELRIIADMSERDENCCAGVALPSANTGANASATSALINGLAGGRAVGVGLDTFDRVSFSNRGTEQQMKDKGISGELTWDLGDFDFVSVTGWRNWETVNGQDTDFTALDIWWRPADGTNGREFTTFSQEFRLQGASTFAGRDLNWLVGVFYADEELNSQDRLLYGADYYRYFVGGLLGNAPAAFGLVPGTILQPGAGNYDRHNQETTSWALFTNNSFAVTDKFEITAGLRYISDEKTMTSDYSTDGSACAIALGRQATFIGALGPATAGAILGNLCLPWKNNGFDAQINEQSRTDEEWTGTLKGAYRWNDSIMTYVSYARGFKSGGFNLDREQNFGFNGTAFVATVDWDTAFEGESVDSYELGAKVTLNDGNLTINSTLFYQEYENFQLNTFLGTNFIVTSIPGVESQGAEVDVAWATPIEGLTFQGGIAYTDTKYVDFTPITPALGLLPGATISFAPEWVFSGSLAYERMVANDAARLRASLNGRWVDDYGTASDQLPAKVQEAFPLFNGRIALSAPDDFWTVELWGQNLFDEDYIQVGFNGPLQGSANFSATPPVYLASRDTITYMSFLGAPRTYGVTIRLRY